MDPLNLKAAAIYVGGSAVLCGVACKIFKFPNLFKHYDDNYETINEVLLYGGDDEDEKKQAGLNNLYCIYYVIAHAHRSIDVCVPSLISETITKCLINVKQKNDVKVRIAIHGKCSEKILKNFTTQGFQVKHIKGEERLEHEFLLIDASGNFEDAVAVVGSLDYETTRVNCNRDNTLLISEGNIVKTLQREFERVWSQTDNSNKVTEVD